MILLYNVKQKQNKNFADFTLKKKLLIEFCKRQIFENSIIHNPSFGSRDFGPADRFSRFDVYWTQTDEKTPGHASFWQFL